MAKKSHALWPARKRIATVRFSVLSRELLNAINPSKSFLKLTLICLALAAGTLALYAPSFQYNFANFDDQLYVINNPHVNTGFHGGDLGWFFQAGYGGLWQPVTWMSYAMDCQLFGMRPGEMHGVNVLLHALNAVLLFLLLIRMTGALWRSAMAAALFAWHPLNVEAVAWIAERKDVLSGLFFLLTLWAYVRYAEQSKAQGPKSKAVLWYGAAVALFAVGLMAKPMLVTLPCLLLLLDFWPLGRLAGLAGRGVAGLAVEKVPFLALSIVSSIMTVIASKADIALATLDVPLKARVVNAAMTYWRYATKVIWPTDLGPQYPYVFHARWRFVAVALVLAGATWLAVKLWKARPYWTVGWFWFVGMLVPSIDLFQLGAQPMADRYMYLPGIGLFILICWDTVDLASRWPRRELILGVTGAVALGAFVMASSQQEQIWRDEGTVVARVAEPEINFLGHANYAAYLMHHDQLAGAEAECRVAMQIAPGRPLLLGLMGDIQRRQGKLDEAAKTLRSALDKDPQFSEAHLPLGQILLQQNKATEAAAQFDMMIQAQPGDAEAHWWRGNAFLAQGNGGEAAREYVQAINLQPNFPNALNDLAWLLATDPQQRVRNAAQAVKLAEKACILTRGTQPQMLGTLAAAYAAAGRWDDAVATAQKAHDVAEKLGDKALAAQNLKLKELYRGRHPYTEKPSL